jgi:hypothetical protein
MDTPRSRTRIRPVDPFWTSPLYRTVKAMKATGNQPGVVTQWKEKVAAWAESQKTGLDAQAVLDMLPLWQVRPFYTAAELAPLIPALQTALGFTEKPGPTIGPATLATRLKRAGLPMLGDGRTYRHPVTGAEAQYFIVERIHHWSKRTLTQQEFERIWNS